MYQGNQKLWVCKILLVYLIQLFITYVIGFMMSKMFYRLVCFIKSIMVSIDLFNSLLFMASIYLVLFAITVSMVL